jgi:hypothetical protein
MINYNPLKYSPITTSPFSKTKNSSLTYCTCRPVVVHSRENFFGQVNIERILSDAVVFPRRVFGLGTGLGLDFDVNASVFRLGPNSTFNVTHRLRFDSSSGKKLFEWKFKSKNSFKMFTNHLIATF